MCKCTPNKRVPFCGEIGCEWPKKEGVKQVMELTSQRPKKFYEMEIKQTKKWRRELDKLLQEIKTSGRPSRERSLATTKLQEAIMWLGMDLKDLRAENQSPNSKDTSNTIIETPASFLWR